MIETVARKSYKYIYKTSENRDVFNSAVDVAEFKMAPDTNFIGWIPTYS